MVKLDPEGHFLEKPSSIWITICVVIVTFAVALATLQGGREVNAANITELKANYASINAKLDLLNQKLNDSAINQAEIKKDIIFIKDTIKTLE